MSSSSHPLVWFHLVDYYSGMDYKGTSSSSVSIPSNYAVDQLRDAVKSKYSDSLLCGFAASNLLVFKNRDSFDKRNDPSAPDAKPLKPSQPLHGLGITEEEALIVAVPG